MYLKIHPFPDGEIVAVCDACLLGTVLRDKKRVLDLSLHSGFYKGKKVDFSEAVSSLSKAKNANLVGKKALSAAKKAGLSISGAVNIGGEPHLQIYQL